MSDRNINPRILRAITRNSGEDDILATFVIALIREEAKHPAGWRYTDFYRKRVKKDSKEWRDENRETETP